MMVEGEITQKLEAASRWLDVMQHHVLTDQ